MYYLYKKSRSVALPKFTYTFTKFQDFYALANVLTASLTGTYYVRIKSDSYKDIMQFIESEGNYPWLNIYIETSQSLMDYITLRKPNINLLSAKSNYETFCDLISKYEMLFDVGCIQILYSAIDHEYGAMVEALELLQQEYPDVRKYTKKEIAALFVVDNLIYPRSVCISYLRLDRWRKSKAFKCVDYFGNDLVLYAIRKNVVSLLDEKIKYLKTGNGSNLIKTIPVNNIVRLYNALHYGRGKFMDILTILDLYEKGETVNDNLQKRALSYTNEKCNLT